MVTNLKEEFILVLDPTSYGTWMDMIKPYGFAIDGCIYGFSRYVIWLEVATTNNNPKVTANFCLQAVKKLEFIPTIIKCDKGTENGLTGDLQICLRKNHEGDFAGDGSFIQGKSVRNQRIESFWGRLRNHSTDFYIQLFKVMQNQNLFDGSDLHVMCLRYCFGRLIKYDLYTAKDLWNEHRIRKQAARNNLFGKPIVLFNLPENYGSKNYKTCVDIEIIEKLIDKFTLQPHLSDPLFEELVNLILPEIKTANSPEEALTLYKEILKLIKDYQRK